MTILGMRDKINFADKKVKKNKNRFFNYPTKIQQKL